MLFGHLVLSFIEKESGVRRRRSWRGNANVQPSQTQLTVEFQVNGSNKLEELRRNLLGELQRHFFASGSVNDQKRNSSRMQLIINLYRNHEQLWLWARIIYDNNDDFLNRGKKDVVVDNERKRPWLSLQNALLILSFPPPPLPLPPLASFVVHTYQIIYSATPKSKESSLVLGDPKRGWLWWAIYIMNGAECESDANTVRYRELPVPMQEIENYIDSKQPSSSN